MAFPYTVSPISHIKLDNRHQSIDHEHSWYYASLTSINIYDVSSDHVLLFGYHKEFIFEEKGFFEISQNKNPLKITRYTVNIANVTRYCIVKLY